MLNPSSSAPPISLSLSLTWPLIKELNTQTDRRTDGQGFIVKIVTSESLIMSLTSESLIISYVSDMTSEGLIMSHHSDIRESGNYDNQHLGA